MLRISSPAGATVSYERYGTDAIIQELPGQAHEGMTTAPDLYAEAVCRVLLDQGPGER